MCLNKFCLSVHYPKGEHARQRFAAVPVISRLRGSVTTRRRIVFKYTELIFQSRMFFFLRTSLELTECVLHSVNQDYLQQHNLWAMLVKIQRFIFLNCAVTPNCEKLHHNRQCMSPL